MSSLRNVDVSCYLANCAGDFARAKVAGTVALAAGAHRLETAAGTVLLDTGPGTTLAACSRPGAGVALGAPQPFCVGLTNVPVPPNESLSEWCQRCLTMLGNMQVGALLLGDGTEGQPLVAARGHLGPGRMGVYPQVIPLAEQSAQTQAKWDGLRASVTQLLSAALSTILRHDLVATAGLVDLPNSDLKLSWEGGAALCYGARTTVRPGLICARVGGKRHAAAHPAEGDHEVGVRLLHEVTLVRADGATQPLRLKAKCVLDAEGPAVQGNADYPAPPGPRTAEADEDAAAPRYLVPAIRSLFTTGRASGSLKLGTGRVLCADLLGVYDDPARPATRTAALARNFALDLRGQRLHVAEPASQERGLTLRADKPLRLVAPQVTGLLPSQLYWLDWLLAKVTSFSLRSARILPNGRDMEIQGTLRLFGLPIPLRVRLPASLPDLDAMEAFHQVDRTLLETERLLADPQVPMQDVVNLIDKERTHFVATVSRGDRLLLSEEVALQARSSRLAVQVSKRDARRFKASYGHRAEIAMQAGTRSVRVGASVSMPSQEVEAAEAAPTCALDAG